MCPTSQGQSNDNPNCCWVHLNLYLRIRSSRNVQSQGVNIQFYPLLSCVLIFAIFVIFYFILKLSGRSIEREISDYNFTYKCSPWVLTSQLCNLQPNNNCCMIHEHLDNYVISIRHIQRGSSVRMPPFTFLILWVLQSILVCQSSSICYLLSIVGITIFSFFIQKKNTIHTNIMASVWLHPLLYTQ